MSGQYLAEMRRSQHVTLGLANGSGVSDPRSALYQPTNLHISTFHITLQQNLLSPRHETNKRKFNQASQHAEYRLRQMSPKEKLSDNCGVYADIITDDKEKTPDKQYEFVSSRSTNPVRFTDLLLIDVNCVDRCHDNVTRKKVMKSSRGEDRTNWTASSTSDVITADRYVYKYFTNTHALTRKHLHIYTLTCRRILSFKKIYITHTHISGFVNSVCIV